MAILHLVRHGRAAAGWDADVDPGLDETGTAQAAAVAAELERTLAVRSVLTSPLRRARETAAPLAERWGVAPQVAPAFGEIPSPTVDLAARARWLDGTLRSTWDDVEPEVRRWRADLVAAAASLSADAVAFTHFVAINALVAEATGARDVTTFLPGNASVTVLEVDVVAGRLRLLELGDEGRTRVG